MNDPKPRPIAGTPWVARRIRPVANTMARSMAPAPTNGRDHDGRPLSPDEPPPAAPFSGGRVVGTKPDVVVRAIVVEVGRGAVVVVEAGTVVVVELVTVVVVGGSVVVVVLVVVVVRRVVVVRLVVVVVGGSVVVVVVGGSVVVVVVGSVVVVVTICASAGRPWEIIQGAIASTTTEIARMSRRRRMEAVTEPLLDRFSRSPHECSERLEIVSSKYWVLGQYVLVRQDLDRPLEKPFIRYLIHRSALTFEVSGRQSDREQASLNSVDTEQLSGMEPILDITPGRHLA